MSAISDQPFNGMPTQYGPTQAEIDDGMARAEADRQRAVMEAEQDRLEKLKEQSKKKIARIKKRQSHRSLEREQERVRKTLTRDSREKLKKKRTNGARVKKQAPGRKSTKKKMPKELARVITARKVMTNRSVRVMTMPEYTPETRSKIVRDLFCDYLKERMKDPDVTAEDWLDWIESEVEQLRSTLRREGAITAD